MDLIDGKRFIVRADEKLTAILELESEIRDGGTAVRQTVLWLAQPQD